MQETNRTEIATLGEFGLIKHLTQNIELKNPETKYGVGDDAAVLEFKDKEVLVTTDLLMEGVHFDLIYTPLKHLGYKSAIVNFSDIYAMNGTPKHAGRKSHKSVRSKEKRKAVSFSHTNAPTVAFPNGMPSSQLCAKAGKTKSLPDAVTGQ